MWATSLLFFHFAPYPNSLLLIAVIPVYLDELRDEHSMLNLTHLISWQRVERHKVHWHFLRTQPPGCILAQFLCHLLTPCSLYSDIGHDLLTIDGVRTANNSGLAHRRMPQEHFLNFARRNVFAPAINHLAQTAPDKQVPLLISPGVTDAQCYAHRAPCRARLMDTWRYWISNHLACSF